MSETGISLKEKLGKLKGAIQSAGEAPKQQISATEAMQQGLGVSSEKAAELTTKVKEAGPESPSNN